MTAKMRDDRVTARQCRWCDRLYVAPVGERWAGCKTCCPTIEDALVNSATACEARDATVVDLYGIASEVSEPRTELQTERIPF